MALDPEDQALLASLTQKVLYLETVCHALSLIVKDKFKMTTEELRRIRLSVAHDLEERAKRKDQSSEEVLRRLLDDFEGTEQ